MKKVLFLQIKGKSKAGVWYVNKTIGEELIKKGYDVTILSIRNNPGDIKLEHDSNLKLYTINENDLWEISRKKDIRSIKTFIKYCKEHKKLKVDYAKAKQYIRNYKPDYIIAAHYQCLDFIPKEYYKITLHEQHSSIKDAEKDFKNISTLKKYSGKIYGFIWLSEATKKCADKMKLKNNYCIYNPVKFFTKEVAPVAANKKIVCISRIENTNKRINLMIKIVNTVLKDNPNWTFEIYGSGEFDKESLKILNNNSRMSFKGYTNDPKTILLSSSINLNTSYFEGFSLSILEASMCGVPTISFNFGESVQEEIYNNKSGYVIQDKNDIDGYISKLNLLMNDEKKLEEFSKECKKFSKTFLKENIILNWINLFKNIDKQKM